MVATVRDTIATVVQTMTAGEREVRDVGDVAAQAKTALDSMLMSIDHVASGVAGAAAVSREQASAMADLSQALEQSDAVSVEVRERATRASRAGAEQSSAMVEVTHTAQQLAELAERLRQAIAHFSVVQERPIERESAARPALSGAQTPAMRRVS